MLYQMLALLIWSSSFIAAKYTYTMLDPALTVQARLLVAAVLVLTVFRRHARRVPRALWKPLTAVAFGNYVLVLMLQFIGLKHTSAASAVTIIGLEPLLMVFVGRFFFGDEARTYHWLCGAAAFAGVALLIAGGGESGGVGLFGCLLVLAGGLAFAAVMRPTQKVVAEIGAPAYTSVSLVLAAVMCLPFSLLLADDLTIHWNAQGVFGLLYLGIGCNWLAYLLWNKGMGSVSANLSGLLIALEPVFGVLLAVLVLGERVTPLSGAGIAVVLAATLVAGLMPRWTAARQKAA